MPAVDYVDGMSVPNYENRDPAPKYQLPFAVDEAMKFIQVPAEFSLDLFATEPDIVKPIAFAFDERGRMWIVETVDYPNEPLGRQARRRSHPHPRGHQRRRHAPTSSRSSPITSTSRRASCSPTAA